VISAEGGPPALPEDSWSLAVPAMIRLVGLDYDPFPLTPTLSEERIPRNVIAPCASEPGRENRGQSLPEEKTPHHLTRSAALKPKAKAGPHP
jgi:hypothetical protein